MSRTYSLIYVPEHRSMIIVTHDVLLNMDAIVKVFTDIFTNIIDIKCDK